MSRIESTGTTPTFDSSTTGFNDTSYLLAGVNSHRLNPQMSAPPSTPPPGFVRESVGGITIDVRPLDDFRGLSATDLNGRMRDARDEKGVEDTRAYSSTIYDMVNLRPKGEGIAIVNAGIEKYNRDYGTDLSVNLQPARAPGVSGGQASVIGNQNNENLGELLAANPKLTGYIMREMAIDSGYYNSTAHNAWAEAASARTGGAISAQWWKDFDAFGGTAGNGPNILATGQYPGTLSRIAMAHDTDWSLGRYFGVGPLRSLDAAPAGNGWWGQGFSPEQLGQVGLVPDRLGGYFFGVDNYTVGHPDWKVQY